MTAYVLEMLIRDTWRRTSQVYWDRSDAHREADRLVGRRLAKRVRLLPVVIGGDAVAEIPATAEASA